MIKSLDVMKLTKDNVGDPLSVAEIQTLLSSVKAGFPAISHIAISVPLGYAPEVEQRWITEIHNAGLRVILRGAFVDSEGLYGSEIHKDTPAYWQGRCVSYINSVKGQLLNGDMVGILPEGTNNAFNGNLFLTGPLPETYNDFFLGMFDAIKPLLPAGVTLATTNNYTEVKSGWVGGSLHAKQGWVVIDHYGSGDQSVADMEADLRGLSTQFGLLPIFLQEWGDTGNRGVTYAKEMCAMFTRLGNENILAGLNLWAGWSAGTAEGILNDDYTLHAKADGYRDFFAGVPTPPPPPPDPDPTPEPVTDLQPVVDAINNISTSLGSLVNLNVALTGKILKIAGIAAGAGTASVKLTAIKAVLQE